MSYALIKGLRLKGKALQFLSGYPKKENWLFAVIIGMFMEMTF